MTRNFDRVQFADLRTQSIAGKPFDDHFNDDHDDLEVAYYQFWKNDLSSPWNGHDKQATPALSKELFDKLHGLIFWHRDVQFHAFNMAQPPARRIAREKYDAAAHDDQGGVTTWRSAESQARIDALALAGIEIPAPFVV